ncbi:hypothetical protein SAMN05444487_104141 [Marininema mesophilum]|uniref:Uncharacterized protein n=1 Tax=Marininema mesophilum TaxID=1048340 RepID=A0A1H2UL81_9BACL|nr:hypothetical protein [Marininema mesophilum]SDW56851.1 hypothetical protein SAMN05444487_104141 [Marininema mesophilum]
MNGLNLRKITMMFTLLLGFSLLGSGVSEASTPTNDHMTKSPLVAKSKWGKCSNSVQDAKDLLYSAGITEPSDYPYIVRDRLEYESQNWWGDAKRTANEIITEINYYC